MLAKLGESWGRIERLRSAGLGHRRTGQQRQKALAAMPHRILRNTAVLPLLVVIPLVERQPGRCSSSPLPSPRDLLFLATSRIALVHCGHIR